MNTTVEISIVNLCYNTGRYVLDTLDSIKGQTYKNFELIIIDDGSTDDSIALIEDWIKENKGCLQITFLKNGQNLGINRSLNHGLKQARGKYLTLMGDDLWQSTFLEQSYAVLSSAPADVCMVYAKSDVMDYHTKAKEYWLEPMQYVKDSLYPDREILFKALGNDVYFLSGAMVQQCLFYSNVFVAFSVLIKLDHLKSVGGYDEQFGFEDMPAWFSLSRKYDFLYIDRYLATYIRHENSFTIKNKTQLHKSMIDLYLHNSDLAKGETVKKDLNERLFHYWYKLYTDASLPKRQLLRYTYKLMCFSPYLFRKFSGYLFHKAIRDVRKRLNSF